MEQSQIEQGARLQNLIRELKHNQASFAQSLGMTQPNISRMVTGESAISVKVLTGITNTYKTVNLHWLLTGAGEMFLPAASESPPMVREPSPSYQTAGKEQLEELEARLARLEAEVRRLVEERRQE